MTAKKAEDIPVISPLADKQDYEFLSTGVAELDELIGGFAKGVITEIWGSEGVGKSYLATKMMAAMSKEHKVLYIDAEFALNKDRVKELGADPKNISYVADARLEKVTELIIEQVGNYDAIILDSLAFLTPLTVDSNEVGENSIGLFARLVKHWVTKLRPRLARSSTALIVINQYRKPFGMYAKPEPPGGTSWAHACDVRIKLNTNSADKITKEGVVIGKWVHAEVTKNKLGAPNRTTKYKLIF